MVGYSNAVETGVIANVLDKKRIVQAWDGWNMREYDVVWSGDSPRALQGSKLSNQKGLLMPDVDMGSATKQIMDHMMMADVDEDTVDPTKLSKLKKGRKIKG
jgi:hypothetical protein